MRVICRSTFIFVLVAFLAGIGCGGEGPAGSSCTVTDNGDGTATIDCEDGTTATVSGPEGTPGTSCTATDNMDGTVTIDCDDGTSVTVTNGTAGDSCTVTDNGDGTATVACDDGTMVIVSDGVAGSSCSAADNMDGTVTVSCTDGTTVTVANGDPGLNAGESPGLAPTVTVSAPANGTHFVAGETIVITITLLDGDGDPVDPSALSTNRLYMAGPRAATVTESAVELLGMSEDRTMQPHHYINLATTTAANLVVAGNVLTYTTNAVTTEAPGTYDIGFRGALAGYTYDRVFTLATAQIGTATAEADGFGGCVDCHLGPDNNQVYMHHVDSNSGSGSPEIDNGAIISCKLCHNTDGYSSIRLCADGTKAESLGGGNYICGDGSSTWSYMVDPILRRAHGVHNGANLVSTLNAGTFNPDFEDYLELVFPADVRLCSKCHTDDRWKNLPSREACGACHDGVNFATPALGIDCDDASDPDLCDHPGGLDLAASACAGCHGAGTGTYDIPVVHGIAPPAFPYTVNLSITAYPNTTHFVAGDAPVVTVEIVDNATSLPIDPATILEGVFGRANLFVSGPREDTRPVLSTSAEGVDQIRAETASANVFGTGFDFSGLVGLDLNIDGAGAFTVLVSSGTFAVPSAATTAEVVAWLNANAAFAALATASVDYSAGASRDEVVIKSNSRGATSTVEVIASDVATAMGLVPGVYVPLDTHYYANNDFRVRTDPFDEDPRITRNATSFDYALDDVASLTAGTYTIWLEVGGAPPMSWAKLNFQVGTAAVDDYTATNCVDCHEDTRMHGGYFALAFDTDMCKSCHDYKNQILGSTGWASMNYGFGAAPIARRVHGVHFGHYVDKPEEIHASYDYSHVIFPMDVRNCTKCHSENDLYASEPNRVACNGCHDSDAAYAHTTLMTVDPTPTAPFSGDELESCSVCHGLGSGLAVDVVHNIWDPYVKPYPR